MPIYLGNTEIGKEYYGVSPQGRIYQGTQIVQGSYFIDEEFYAYYDASNPASYPGSGSTWFDLSGNNNNLTLSGSGITYNTNSFSFNSTGRFINTSGSSMGTGSQLTVCGWVKSPGYSNFNPRSWFSFETGSDYWYFGIQDRVGSEYPRQFYQVRTSLGQQIIDTDNNINPIDDNEWYFYAFVISGSTAAFAGPGSGSTGPEMPQVYANGKLIYRQGDSYAGGTLVLPSNPQLILGGDLNSTPTEQWTGSIGEVAVYTKTLSSLSILNFYEATRGKY